MTRALPAEVVGVKGRPERRETEIGPERRCTACLDWWPEDAEFFQVIRAVYFSRRCLACINERRRPQRQARTDHRREVERRNYAARQAAMTPAERERQRERWRIRAAAAYERRNILRPLRGSNPRARLDDGARLAA